MAYIDPRIVEEARRLGIPPDVYARMLQGPGAGVSAPQLPQQRPFAQGPGPGGGYGGGQGQTQGPAPPIPGIGAQVSPAADYAQAYPQQPQDHSIFGQIKAMLGMGGGAGPSGVSLGTRLGNVGAIISAMSDPQGRSLAPTLVNVNDQMAQARDLADRKDAYYAELARQQQMAESLYNNLKDTNPQMAEMIRANPALVQDYMKGQLDLNKETQIQGMRSKAEMALEKQRETGALNLKKYELENSPDAKRLARETDMWNSFVSNNGGNLDSVGLYNNWYKGEKFTPAEAQRLADANMRDGIKGMDEAYGKIIDDRSKGKEVSAMELAAKASGIKLKEGEMLDSAYYNQTGQLRVMPAPGSQLEKSVQAEKTFNWKTDSADYLATQRAIDALDNQLSGNAWTGSGYTGYGEYVPETNARELGRALQSVNAGEAFRKLVDIRKSNPNGAGVGNVTEGEYPIMTAAEGEKFDILQEPELLKNRLIQHQNIQTAYMSLYPGDPSKSLLQGLVDDLRKSPTPEHMKEFDDKFGSGYAQLVLNTKGNIPR